jgi:phage terminase large subunit GpA-like protein
MTILTSMSPFRKAMKKNARVKLRAITSKLFKARPAMTGSEYADKFGVLVEGDKVVKWKTYPFQVEILDAFADVTIPEVVVMKSARQGISECMNQAIQKQIHWEPAPILMYRPKEADAERYMERRFDARSRAVPEVAELLFLTAGGKRTEKKTERKFRNGASLMVLGAESEDNFRDHTVKPIYLDELDALGFAPVKGGGNKYDLARRRGYQYWDSTITAISTPKFPAEEGGRIHGLFLKSDQRHYYVKCPHCGHEFTPEWGDAESIGGMRWNKDDPTEVWYECHNPDLEERCRIEHHEKKGMTEGGRWIPHNPEITTRRGYYVWQWYSYAPKASWQNMVREWLEACQSGPAQIQSFKNEVLGLPFSQNTGRESGDIDTLSNCVVDLGEGIDVPAWAVALLWGVDRQRGGTEDTDSYLEATLWAFGPNRRLFQVGHWVLDEFPQSDDRAWDALEALATRTFIDEKGRPRHADGLAIDHNGGDSNRVVEWLAKVRKNDRAGKKYWVAVRGESKGNGSRGKTIWPTGASKKNNFLYTVDVDLAKDEIAPILSDGALEFNANSIEGSVDLSDDAECQWFLKRLLLEKEFDVPNRPGATIWKGPKGKGRNGNEPFDNVVYALALSYGMTQMPGGIRWRKKFDGNLRFRAAPVIEGEAVEIEAEDNDAAVIEAPAEVARIKVPRNPVSGQAPTAPNGTPMVRVRSW